MILKERMREFVEKVSERMLKLQLEEDKELQKDIKQRDSLFILLEKMVSFLFLSIYFAHPFSAQTFLSLLCVIHSCCGR